MTVNKRLLAKLEKLLVEKVKNKSITYDDIIEEINKNKHLREAATSIPNAINFFTDKNITIIDNKYIDESKTKDDLEIKYMKDIETDEYTDYENMETITWFMNYIRNANLSVLSKEKEHKLIIKAQNGDITARDLIIMHNIRLVISIAKSYTKSAIANNSVLSMMDLIQHGIFGIIDALERFDVSLNYKFSTYSIHWIRQRITRAITLESRTIKIPVHIIEKQFHVNKAIKAIKKEKNNINYSPTPKEIADKCNENRWWINKHKNKKATEEEIKELFNIIYNEFYPVSLEKELMADSEDDFLLIDTLDDGSYNKMTKNNYNKDIQNILIDVIDEVIENTTHARILKLRFGLGTNMPMKLTEIGERFGLCKERIRQIVNNCLRQIRVSKYARKRLKGYYIDKEFDFLDK